MVSYNIHHGAGMDGVVDFRNAAWVVMRERPRFVGLQEVERKSRRVSGVDGCAVLAKTSGMHVTFAKAIDYAGGEYGNAVLSEEPPLDVRRIPLPGLRR